MVSASHTVSRRQSRQKIPLKSKNKSIVSWLLANKRSSSTPVRNDSRSHTPSDVACDQSSVENGYAADISSSGASALSKSSVNERSVIKFDSTDSSFLRNVNSYCAENLSVTNVTQPEAPSDPNQAQDEVHDEFGSSGSWFLENVKDFVAKESVASEMMVDSDSMMVGESVNPQAPAHGSSGGSCVSMEVSGNTDAEDDSKEVLAAEIAMVTSPASNHGLPAQPSDSAQPSSVPRLPDAVPESELWSHLQSVQKTSFSMVAKAMAQNMTLGEFQISQSMKNLSFAPKNPQFDSFVVEKSCLEPNSPKMIAGGQNLEYGHLFGQNTKKQPDNRPIFGPVLPVFASSSQELCNGSMASALFPGPQCAPCSSVPTTDGLEEDGKACVVQEVLAESSEVL